MNVMRRTSKLQFLPSYELSYVDESSLSFFEKTQHLFRIARGQEQRVLYPIDGKITTLLVSTEELNSYGMNEILRHPESFQRVFDKTKALMQGLNIEHLSDKETRKYILHTLHSFSQESNSFIAIATKKPRHIRPLLQDTLLVYKDAHDAYTAHKVQAAILARGGCAYIHAVGDDFVMRISCGKQALQQQMLHNLQKIYALGLTEGIEPLPKILSHIDATTSTILNHEMITISPRALDDCLNLLGDLTNTQEQLIAHRMIQALHTCIVVKVGHLDIKLENILLYGTKTDRHLDICDAKLCDFEGAIPLDDKAACDNAELIQTKENLLYTDWEQARLLTSKQEDFPLYSDMIYAMMIFQTGKALYELFVKERLPVTQESETRGYILEVRTSTVTKKLSQISHLSTRQREILYTMLHTRPADRPSIETIIHAFPGSLPCM